MITTVQLVERLGFANRVVGVNAFCGCGHVFRDDEPKWPTRVKGTDKGELLCSECHERKYPPREGAD